MRAVPYYDESITGRTWVARALDLSDPWDADRPLRRPRPVEWQTGFPAEYAVFLPDAIGGEVPAAEAFIAAQIALQTADAGGPVPAITVPVGRFIYPSAHGTYTVDVPAGLATQIYLGSRERSYSLIVNTGANDATLAYGKDADANSLLLASGGVGFHELVFGTTSSASVFSAAGTQIVVTDGRHDPALDAEDGP